MPSMAFQMPIFQARCLTTNRPLSLTLPFDNTSHQAWSKRLDARRWTSRVRRKTAVVVSAEMPGKPEEEKGFAELWQPLTTKLLTGDQARKGKLDRKRISRWEPTVEGYIRFLRDNKLVYDTLEYIVEEAHCPWYAEFRNTGLERSEVLAKDLEWFKEQGQAIPEPSTSALTYSQFLKELSRKDPHAFICHFYNIYVAHTSSGCMIGKKVAEIILDSRELEFYQWKGAIGLLLQNLREKLHKIANDWPSEEKTRCLEETMKSFKYSGEILRLISP